MKPADPASGLQAAQKWASGLPVFASEDLARQHLFAVGDQLLEGLVLGARSASGSELDYSIESIQRLEDWYFELCDGGQLAKHGDASQKLELAIPVYSAAVAVRHKGARWDVYREPFTNVGGFVLLVNKGNFGVTLRTCGVVQFPHHQRPSNARRNLLLREFKRHWK